MATPDFIRTLRAHVGPLPLWLSGATACVHRAGPHGTEWLLARRADTGAWAPISGIVDPGEHPAATAEREVAEEAGVTAVVERLVWLGVTGLITYDNGDQTQYIDHAFRCRWTTGEPYAADGENLEAAFFPEDALPPMAAEHAAVLAIAVRDEPECALGPLA